MPATPRLLSCCFQSAVRFGLQMRPDLSTCQGDSLSSMAPTKRQSTPEGCHSSILLEARHSLSSLTGNLSACRVAQPLDNLHLSDIAELLALPPNGSVVSSWMALTDKSGHWALSE